MIIGVPKEIKNCEYRVSIVPSGVKRLCNDGHRVLVEASAGIGVGVNDEDYINAGAEIVDSPERVFARADMIVKVKEPLEQEYGLIKPGQLLFTYLHLAASRMLTKALIDSKVTAVAYETIRTDDGALPLLAPMSEIAGRMSIQIGAQFLEKLYGGKGMLLAGVPGVNAAEVVIVGGGIVGTNAARIALGMGARVTLLDINAQRLRYLEDVFDGRIQTLMSNLQNIEESVRKADLLVGAVLNPGKKAPCLVTESMVKTMEPGSVIVDVAVDQGGCVETIDHATTHSNPTYEKFGVLHYAVANIPGAVARTSTYALTNATFPYVLRLANMGYAQAAIMSPALQAGLNMVNGRVTLSEIAEQYDLPYTPADDILGLQMARS